MDPDWRATLPAFSFDFLAKYEILGLLGEGGMGRVYRARQIAGGRHVAIKVLKHMGEEESARFVRESQTLAALVHPRILKLLDAGCDGQIPYQICELVEGKTVQEALDRGELDRATALRVVAEVAEALAFAHGRGLVHRDVKPENVFLTSNGDVLLADFGLARPMASGNTLTAASLLLGTPGYLSPEQLEGARASPASDQYALGVMAFQLLTNQLPFESDTVLEMLQARLSKPAPSVRSLAPDVPAPVELAIAQALARDPRKRHATVADLAKALSGLSTRQGRKTGTTRTLPRAAIAAFAAVVLVVLALGARSLRPRTPARNDPSAALSPPTVAPATPSPQLVDPLPPLLEEILRARLPVQRGPKHVLELVRERARWASLVTRLRELGPELMDRRDRPLELRRTALAAVGQLRAFDAICRAAGVADTGARKLLGRSFGAGIDLDELEGQRRIAVAKASVPVDLPTDLPTLPRGPLEVTVGDHARACLEVKLQRLSPQDALWLELTSKSGTWRFFIDDTCEPRTALETGTGVAFHSLDPAMLSETVHITATAEHVAGPSQRSGSIRLARLALFAGPPAVPLPAEPGPDLSGKWAYRLTRVAGGAFRWTGTLEIGPRGLDGRHGGRMFEPGGDHTVDRVVVRARGDRVRIDRVYHEPSGTRDVQSWFLKVQPGRGRPTLVGHAACASGRDGTDDVVISPPSPADLPAVQRPKRETGPSPKGSARPAITR